MTRNFEEEILECIKKNPTGVTIQDIADEIKAARNTISKYILKFEINNKVFKKKLGAYFLYFSTERNLLPEEMVLGYYKGFLFAMKKFFPNNEEIFKEIGYEIAKFYQVTFENLPKLDREMDSVKNLNINTFFKIFSKFYPNFDFLQRGLKVNDVEVNYMEKKAKYRFLNSNFMEKSENFIYHFYIMSGIIEASISKILDKVVICNVENINIKNDIKESFVEIVIEIK